MKFYLKKVVLDLSKAGHECVGENLSDWAKRLGEQGIAVSCQSEETGCSSLKDGSSEVLWITDDPRLSQEHLRRGAAVLAFLHRGNEGDGFEGVKFLVMELQDVDADYLDKVYRRYLDIPWDILETERCFLRETTLADVDVFYDIYAEPSITKYMEDLFADREAELAYTKDYKKNIYEFYGYGIWTVCLKETGEVIGRAGLTNREGYEQPELGFVIGVPWQGRGIATEVCRAILAFGKEELGFTEVIAFAEPDNIISIHLLQKLGFQRATGDGSFWHISL